MPWASPIAATRGACPAPISIRSTPFSAKHPAAFGHDRPDSRQAIFAAIERPQRIVLAHLRVEPADRLALYVGRVGEDYIRPSDRRQPVADDEQRPPRRAPGEWRSPARS